MDTQPRAGIKPPPPHNMLRDVRHDLAEAERHRHSIPDGRHGWPDIFVYVWIDGEGAKHKSACPPTLGNPAHIDTTAKAVGSRAYRTEPCTWPAKIELIAPNKLPLYEALASHGRLRDPGHTGASAGEAIDNRRAPAEG